MYNHSAGSICRTVLPFWKFRPKRKKISTVNNHSSGKKGRGGRVAKSATQHTVMGTEKLYGIAISNYLIVCGPFPLLILNTGNYDKIILYLEIDSFCVF